MFKFEEIKKVCTVCASATRNNRLRKCQICGNKLETIHYVRTLRDCMGRSILVWLHKKEE